MTNKVNVTLGDVQQTLLLPLWGRAIETQKVDPLLIDNKAVEIIDQLDYDFSMFSKKINEISKLGWVIRSLLIDKTVKQFIGRYPQATIVNIGCGFDTTFERVDNGSINWYDLDLPAVIDSRKRFIYDNARRKSIAKSILDYTWLDQIQPHNNLLIVAAGVLYYFEEKQIAQIFKTIAQKFPGSEMVFDATSSTGLKMANRMVIKNSGMKVNSYLKWGLKNVKALSLFDDRINILNETLFFNQFKSQLKVKTRLIAYISDLLRMQYLVHIKFNNRI